MLLLLYLLLLSSSRGKPKPRPSERASTAANAQAATTQTLFRLGLAGSLSEDGRASALVDTVTAPSSMAFMSVIIAVAIVLVYRVCFIWVRIAIVFYVEKNTFSSFLQIYWLLFVHVAVSAVRLPVPERRMTLYYYGSSTAVKRVVRFSCRYARVKCTGTPK